MDTAFHEVYSDVEKAIDYAFNGQFVLKFYDYLKSRGVKKTQVEEFIDSPTTKELNDLVSDLDEYIKGGADNDHKQSVRDMVTSPNLKQERYEIIFMQF